MPASATTPSSRATTCSACGRTPAPSSTTWSTPRAYIAECEERHGIDAVEEMLDACHALMNYGVDRYRRPQKISMVEEENRRKDREAYLQQQVNDLWRTLPTTPGKQAEEGAQALSRGAAGEHPVLHREERAAAGALAARDRAHRAQGRAVLLSAAPDPGDERGLGHVLALHPAQHHVRRGPAGRRLHDGVPELAHQRGVPAAGDASGLQRHQPVCAGLRDVHRPAAHLREARPTRTAQWFPDIAGTRLAQDAGLRDAPLQGRELHRPVPVAAADARVPAVLRAGRRRADGTGSRGHPRRHRLPPRARGAVRASTT